MKKLILTLALSGGVAAGAFAQGLINVDNVNNTSSSQAATSLGLVFQGNAPFNGAFSVSVEGGASAGTATNPIVTLLHLGGGAGLLTGGDIGAPGQFLDSNGANYAIPGVALNAVAFLDVQFWTGSSTSYAAAMVAPGAFIADSGVFQNPTGGGGTVPPQDLLGLPAVTLTSVPEPGTMVLGGLGAAALLLFRRRKQ